MELATSKLVETWNEKEVRLSSNGQVRARKGVEELWSQGRREKEERRRMKETFIGVKRV